MSSNNNADEASIRKSLGDFIVSNFLFGDVKRAPAGGDSFIEKGILDSTGILELIEFLESEFAIQVSDTETVPKNLDSIDNVTRFVLSKKA